MERQSNYILVTRVLKLCSMDMVNKPGLMVALMKDSGSMACKKDKANKTGQTSIQSTQVNGVLA